MLLYELATFLNICTNYLFLSFMEDKIAYKQR